MITKSLPLPTPLGTPVSMSQPSSEGHTWIGQCMGAVDDMACAVLRGDEPAAQGARRTLDTLCWSPSGYPAFVVSALDARDLRSTPHADGALR